MDRIKDTLTSNWTKHTEETSFERGRQALTKWASVDDANDAKVATAKVTDATVTEATVTEREIIKQTMSLSNDGCTYRDEKEDHSRFRSKKPIEDGATILDILTYLSHPVHSLIGSGQLLEQITTRFKSIAKSGHRAYPEDDREKDRKSLRDLLTTWQANNSAKQKYPDCLDKPLPKDLQDSLNIMRSWYNTKQDLSGYETNDLYDKVKELVDGHTATEALHKLQGVSLDHVFRHLKLFKEKDTETLETLLTEINKDRGHRLGLRVGTTRDKYTDKQRAKNIQDLQTYVHSLMESAQRPAEMLISEAALELERQR